MSNQYAYITGCSILFIVWTYMFVKRKDLRSEMLWASLWGMPFGFIDFFLVPTYWNPDSLFGLIKRYGVGIESFLFLFLMSGISAAIYEFVWKKKLVRLPHAGRPHLWLLFFIPAAYVTMSIMFPTKSIYNLMVVTAVGASVVAFLRRDLRKHIFMSALIFSLLYLAVFVFINLIFPNLVYTFYNLKNLWGVMVLGVPVEEIVVAFCAGAFWSTIYEYTKAYRERRIG